MPGTCRGLTLPVESSKISISADLKPACGRFRNPAKEAGNIVVLLAFGFPQRLDFGPSTVAWAIVLLPR